MSQILIDQYLAICVRAVLQGTPLPPWPKEWSQPDNAQIIARIKFHGVALLLAGQAAAIAGWNHDVAAAVNDEARLQAIWEASHQQILVRLIDALHAEDARPVVIKGTALAYSAYDDPAIRRRGDSDILLAGVSKRAVRSVLKKSGFEPNGVRGPTQESWSVVARGGFRHEIDVHWRISSTLVVAEAIERMNSESRVMPLPSLSPLAFGLGGIDNLILTCVNRASHDAFGYYVEADRLTDGDRLIWALDILLVTEHFDEGDWAQLANLADISGTASLVRSGLMFAHEQLGAMPPAWVLERLMQPASDQPVTDYFSSSSDIDQLKRNLSSSASIGEKLTLLKQHALPDRRFMDNRFPAAQHWPLWALRVRRLTSAGLKLLDLRS